MATTTNIPRQPATSTSIASHGYDPATQTLAIEFKGGYVYHYAGVPQDVADQFGAHPSTGAAFLTLIRGSYPNERVEDAVDQPF